MISGAFSQSRAAVPEPLILTNSLDPQTGCFGTILTSEQIGGDHPGPDSVLSGLPGSEGVLWCGDTSQWRLFAITNDLGYTNAAFVLFDPAYASGASSPTNSSRPRDFDLYVSTDPSLLDFGAAAFAASAKSLAPGPDELVVESSAMPATYYIAVKCESPDSGEFGIAALFSEAPFEATDTSGSMKIRFVPVPAVLAPTGTQTQAVALAFGFPASASIARRASVDMTISQDAGSRLQASLHHAGRTVVLGKSQTEDGAVTNRFVFDDSLEHDIPNAANTSGPGSLADFACTTVGGPWILALTGDLGSAVREEASLNLDVQQRGAVTEASVLAGSCHDEFLEIPAGATNFIFDFDLLAGSGPLHLDLAPVGYKGESYNDLSLAAAPTSGKSEVNARSNPPISPGFWRVRACNSGPDAAAFALSSSASTNTASDPVCRTRLSVPQPLLDSSNAVFLISVTNAGTIHQVEAALRLDHPRLSDLEIWLISPRGTRVSLDSHRGGISTNGMGHNIIVTNVYPVPSSGGPKVSTNRINLKRTSGVITVDYDFYALPDSMRIYFETNLIFDSGLISDSGVTNISYGPGRETFLTVVMNEGDNPDPDTAWFYTITSVAPDFAFLTFKDGALPIKFAPEPFDVPVENHESSFAYGPEEPLAALQGQVAAGTWALEIRDTVAGPAGVDGWLHEFELGLVLRNDTPEPVPLISAENTGGALVPGQVQWFRVDVPPWTAFSTNCFSASAPLSMVYSAQPGSWVAEQAITNSLILTDVPSGCAILSVGVSPPLLPGNSYFLGLINSNNVAVTFSVSVNLQPDVTPLYNGQSISVSGLGPGQSEYYNFAISDRAKRAEFQLSGLSGNMALLVKKDLPLPAPGHAALVSDNPGTQMELITLRQDSSVPVSAGNWYVCASNASTAPVNYTVSVHYWAATGAPLVATNSVVMGNELCITWGSLPGAVYHLETSADLDQPWVKASPAIIAPDASTTYCCPISEPSAYFRILEGPP